MYATEEALDAPRLPLSESLQRFVRVENKTFNQELSRQPEEEEGEALTATAAKPIPVSPSKRKYRSGSIDSMATNRASMGNSDADSRAGDFAVEDGFPETEMVDMSAGDRDAELQTRVVSPYFSRETTKATGSETTDQQQRPAELPYRDTEMTVEQAENVEKVPTANPEEAQVEKAPEMQEREGNSPLFSSSHFSKGAEPAERASGDRTTDN